MIRNSLKAHLLAAAAVAALAVPVTAHAAGYALKEQSVSGQGTSFAGVTAGGNGDASAMFFNPAAMGLVQGGQIVQTFTGVLPYSKAESVTATRATRAGGSRIAGSTDPGDAANDAIVPAGYFVYSISNDLKVGLSANGPWGLVTDYGAGWAGRYHGIRSDLRTYNFTPTVSYRVLPQLTVGAGLQVQYAKAKLSQASDFALRRGLPPGSLDITSDMVGDDWGFGATAGILYEPMKGTRLGLSYRSSVKHTLKGTLSFDAPAALRAALPNQGISADMETPDIVSFGAYHEINDRWAVMADVQWTNWSKFKELRVNAANPAFNAVTEENWKDSWFYSLGTSYKATDALTLRAGIAYDQTPIPNEFRTPRIPDEDRLWLSIGAGYKVTEWIQVDAAYTHIFVKNSSVDLRDNLTGPNTGRGNLTVNYKNHVDLIGLQARISF
ncbi:OmpP1/FadL family transporter [Azospirillum sp.]|uniref:OmpP1/FadL family transporter n=1 Tax=Azospirillum sp. TaxID=34012 RepID=UPI002D3149E0|nr:outer membrane protein transport protein [Azospirillum sp.]HYD65149.1 outer membrane protein transport protein [Azospirillum sp.]